MMHPKPHLCFRSKSERLPDRKHMTLAMGIVAQDGIVVAADREEGDGYVKNDRGKIACLLRGLQPAGRIAVSGAGHGPPLDEVSGILTNVFCEDKERTPAEAKEALKRAHRAYYRKIILPFARQPIDERPEYKLIIGCCAGPTGKALFSTSRLACNEINDYDTVGVGSTIANLWLDKLYDNMPVMAAIKLAAYVVYQVKNTVSGVGLGTNIFVLSMSTNSLFGKVNPAIIRRWEEVFMCYPALERNIFSYCIGVEPSPARLGRTRPDKASIDKDMEKVREVLTQSDAQPLESVEE